MATKQITPQDLHFTPAEWADKDEDIEVAESNGYLVIIEVKDEGKHFAWTVEATSEIVEDRSEKLIDTSERWGYKNRGHRQAVRMALVVLNRELRNRAKAARKAQREAEKAEAELSEVEQQTLQTAVDALNGDADALETLKADAVESVERMANEELESLRAQREAASGQAKAALTRKIKAIEAKMEPVSA